MTNNSDVTVVPPLAVCVTESVPGKSSLLNETLPA